MGAVAELMDLARAKGFDTDMALAARLGKSRQIASQWRSGGKFPEDETIIDLAKLAGVDPGNYLVRIQAERSGGASAKAWQALAKRLGAAAAVALLVMGFSPSPAVAKMPIFKAFSEPMYIMSSVWKLLQWIRAVLLPQAPALASSPA